MNDELLVIGSLDQDLLADDSEILAKIEEVIMESIAEHNFAKASHVCNQLRMVMTLGGKALAKTLYLIKSNWSAYNIHDDPDDTIASTTGLHKSTIQRYTAVWGMKEDNLIPEEYVDEIMSKNIKSLIPIAQALDAGYDINDDEWKDLANTNDFSSINEKLRKIKGKEPRSNSLSIYMDRDGGLKAFKIGTQKYIGWLNVDDEDEIVKQAIERLIKGGGILEQ
jgi:hypothetical protein